MRLVLTLLLWFQVPSDPPFDQVKHLIARYESANGEYKINVNANRTVDCGLYQINSVHFSGNDNVARAFNVIFGRYGVGDTVHERVAAAILNDELNEALARKLYELRGLKAWTSSRRFIR